MSEIKVNKISPRTACGTTTLGDSGDTFTIPAGVTITNSGTAAGFGATGAASWDTTVKTTGFTAVSGVGYFVNTTAGIITVTLPASPSAGDVVAVSDYAGTADTNNITIGRNSSNINGAASDQLISIENSAVTLVYVDGTQGWKATDTSSLADIALQPIYITATGGTITTVCTDYKVHTFTGPGTFTVSCAGNVAGSNLVDYMVVAGGGGSGAEDAGGGGAGGFRESSGTASGSYSASPLGACVSALPVAATGYPIVIGGGGAAGTPPTATPSAFGIAGGISSGLGITSAGGGGGGGGECNTNNGIRQGKPGGSGGGGAGVYGPQPQDNPDGPSGGTGNTPSVSPSQGFPGGNGPTLSRLSNSVAELGGGGGGATQAGQRTPSPTTDGAGGAGGAGATTSINGSPTAFAGGGAGGVNTSSGTGSPGAGGVGGGGNGGYPASKSGTAGTTNTGGGGGGDGGNGGSPGGAGGSGIVIIRYKFQN
jgi:hypothetical protein